MYKIIIRPILFLFDPEDVHHFVFSMLKWIFRLPGAKVIARSIFKTRNREVRKMGLIFPNAIGLAAGFDKDAKLYNELACFGFGFIEIGTLTPKPQPGNEKPRMFRIPSSKALINRMGFNNEGVGAAVIRLKSKHDVLIGGNIGKNKITPNENAIEDYLICFNELFNYVDYFVINVSSPNTPGLRALQEKEPLLALLNAVQEANHKKEKPKPVLLKIAPDLTWEQIEEVIDIVKSSGLSGIVATNTTIERAGISVAEKFAGEAGGLSGLPVRNKSTEIIRFIRERAGNELVLIGVGGIFTAEDAREKLDAGADLVQVYTGFIYEGPSIVSKICRDI